MLPWGVRAGVPVVSTLEHRRLKLSVCVTADHIAHGKKGDECACPIALALLAAGAKWSEVLRIEARVVVDGRRYIGELPMAAVAFVRDFDKARHVEPLSFELAMVEWGKP